MNKIVLPLLLTFIFTGCATTKISPETRNQFNQTQIALKAQPVSILVNPCLLTNELGKDLVLNHASQLTSEKFIQIFSQQLNQNGIQIGATSIPFICGAMPETQLKKFDYHNESTKRTAIENYPFLNDKNLSMSAEQQTAVLHLYQYIAKTDEVNLANSRNKKEKIPIPTLDAESLNVLKDWSKSNYIFVASLDGLDASVGSKFAMGALSFGVTLATMGAGAGFVTAYMPKEGQHYTLKLFDLENQKFIWVKTDVLKGKVFSEKNNTVEADAILEPLFESQQK